MIAFGKMKQYEKKKIVYKTYEFFLLTKRLTQEDNYHWRRTVI